MYEVYLDGQLLYYPADEENVLLYSQLDLDIDNAGTFDFEIPPGNPLYDSIETRRSMVQVQKDGKEIFYGEVREVEKDFYNVKQVSVTGELAFLFDSIQPQAEYHDLSTRQMLETWLNIHNSQVEERKKFYVGIVTIHDSNDSLYRYTNRETTLDAIREKLLERLDGYLRIRKVDGKRYLDWIALEEYGKYCEQPIEFGANLLDYAEFVSGEELATAVIPLGARLEESPIEALEAYTDITSVNGGKDYLYIPEAVNRFGWVKRVVNWDDVMEPANLKTKGQKWLQDNQYEDMTLELTALDLSDLRSDFEAFELGDMVSAIAEPYGMDRTFPVRKMTIYLQQPDSNKLSLGSKEKRTFSSQVANSNRNFSTELDNTRQTTAWMQSAINNATAMMTGSKGGYKVTEFDEDGRWLRDLYMNAPVKEKATRLMQINMNGIGFSRDGFNGPYKNAWTIDGVFLGEFIKAGSVQAEALSAEYKSGVTAEITAKFKVAEGFISAEVTRATKAEGTLSASLKITSEQILQKVSKGDVSSQLSLESDVISLRGPRLEVDTDKFKMAKDGTTRLINSHMEVFDDERAIAITSGFMYFGDNRDGLDAGMLSFNPVRRTFCVGGYGAYSLELGYWAGSNDFKEMITLKADYDGEPIRFNGGFSVIGKSGITEDISFIGEDGEKHWLHFWHGIITGVD